MTLVVGINLGVYARCLQRLRRPNRGVRGSDRCRDREAGAGCIVHLVTHGLVAALNRNPR
jgi:hypothetical protein